MKKTTQELTFIYNPSSGSFTLDEGQNLPSKYHSRLTVPKGTPITHQTAMGYDENYNFVVGNSFAERYYHHDLEYHGINVPKQFVN